MPIFTPSDFDKLKNGINLITDYDIYSFFDERNINLKNELNQISHDVAIREIITENQLKLVRKILVHINQNYPDIDNQNQSQNPILTSFNQARYKTINEKVNTEKVKKPGTNNPKYLVEDANDVIPSNLLDKKTKKQSSTRITTDKKVNCLLDKSPKHKNDAQISNSMTEQYKQNFTSTNFKKKQEYNTTADKENLETKEIYYAAHADLPDGFSVSRISVAPNKKDLFTLMLGVGKRGTFCVTESKLAHEKALDNPNFLLEKACDFDNSITEGNKIKTLKYGEITLSGSVWKITKKAIIKFV